MPKRSARARPADRVLAPAGFPGTPWDGRFSRQAVSASSNCPALPLALLKDSGRLEFSNNDTYMIEWFDVQPGDDIAAFKFVMR